MEQTTDPNGMEVTTNFTYANIRSDEDLQSCSKAGFVDVPGSITNLNDIDADQKYFAEIKRLVQESKRRKSQKKNNNSTDVESTLNVNDLENIINVEQPAGSLCASDPAIHYETETSSPEFYHRSPPSLAELQLRKYEETSLSSNGINAVFLVLYLLAALIQVGILLYVSRPLVLWLWSTGIDPDSSSIPYLTSSGDLLGGIVLSAAFHIDDFLNLDT